MRERPRLSASALATAAIALIVASGAALVRADDAQSARPDLKSARPDAKAVNGEASTSAGLKLLSEGDALADKGELNQAVLLYKQAFEKLLPSLRRIPFKHEVKKDVTKREKLKDVVLKDLDEDKPGATFHDYELGLKALGFLPRDFDLKKALVDVYAEEIAAFYDPKTKTMHLIEETAEKLKKKPGLLERLMGKKEGFDKDENKTVIAHELTHALADQHFDLDALHVQVRGDDDREAALSALIEGEATLAMMGAQMQDWDGAQTVKLPAENMGRSFGLLGPFLPYGGGKALRDAPPLLVETMMFPYLRGMVFCASLANKGGWDAINAAYDDPPRSTEQILHPEKYKDQPDPPTSIDLGKLEAPAGWREIGRNVVGELQLGILLRKQSGKRVAEGWDGDRYAVFEGPDGKLGLVWLVTWDAERDARVFAKAYARFQSGKIGQELGDFDPKAQLSLRRASKGASYAVDRKGVDVAIVEGFPAEATSKLIEAALRAKKSETPGLKPKSEKPAARKAA